MSDVIDTGGVRRATLRSRWYRPVMVGLTVVILVVAASIAWITWDRAASIGRVGADLSLYVDATRDYLSGTGFYPERQLSGPYTVADGDILYPPPTIALFAAFLVLPAALFWILPLGATSVVVLRHRPAPWTWPLMALGAAYPVTSLKVVHGNPFMWIMAAVALGTVYRWPAVFALLKPTLAPFALIGARHRSWWLGLAIGGVASLALGSLWFDYANVLGNARSSSGALYSLDEVPMMLIPVIAWLGSPRFRLPDAINRRLPTRPRNA